VNARKLCFKVAAPSDAHEIYELVYRNPHPFLRTTSLNEIESWIENGVCWVVLDSLESKIIGACNIKVPKTNPDQPPEPAEFGGVFVQEDYRRLGVGDFLSVFALASYYRENDPDSPNPVPLISHVHIQNNNPLRILRDIGFEFVTIIQVPEGVPGFENMPRNSYGHLFGKEFHFPADRRREIFEKMAKLFAIGQLGDYLVEIERVLDLGPLEFQELAENIAAQHLTRSAAEHSPKYVKVVHDGQVYWLLWNWQKKPTVHYANPISGPISSPSEANEVADVAKTEGWAVIPFPAS
jgi:hypothetical protein